MTTLLNIDGSVLEHLFMVVLRSKAHELLSVLLAETLSMLTEICPLLCGELVTIPNIDEKSHSNK